MIIRFISTILLACILFSACSDGASSTNENPQNEKNVFLEIYEVINLQYADQVDDGKVNHTNVVSDEIEYSVDSTISQSTTIQIAGKEQSAQYKQTLYYPVGDYKLHQYAISTNLSEYIYLREDGSLAGVNNLNISIDVPKPNAADEVQKNLEAVIAKVLDISKYEYVNAQELNYNSLGTAYNFTYYNLFEGYMTDRTSIAVWTGGEVVALWINESPLPKGIDTLNINKSIEQRIITEKLEYMYNSNEYYTYCSHSIHENSIPTITIYKGELCISYLLDCTVTSVESENEFSYAINLIIPLRLMTK